MNLICKQCYPLDGNLVSNNIYQDFLIGNTYKVLDKIYVESDDFWYRVQGEFGKTALFSQSELDDYFIDIKKERKEKLLKLKEKFE